MIGIKGKSKFNRRELLKRMRSKSINSLGHAGASTRLIARRSIRRSKNASRAGSPPHTRRGQIKRALRYNVEKTQERVLIGPTYSVVGRSARAHEFGGRYRGQKYPIRALMGPALEVVTPKLPKLWAGSIK